MPEEGGIIYLALNTAYQKEEIRYFSEDAEPALFVADPAKAKLKAAALVEANLYTQWTDKAREPSRPCEPISFERPRRTPFL